MSRKQLGIAVAILIVVGGAVAWRFRTLKPDPKLVALEETQKQLINLPETSTREERREIFGKMREQAEELTPEQREEMQKTGPKKFMAMINKRIGAYFELPPEQRVAFLDKEIKRMESFMRDMRPPGAAPGGGGQGGGGGDAPPGPPRNMGNRDEMQKRFLDNTTPIQRAQMTEYFNAMQARRKELGLATFPTPF